MKKSIVSIAALVVLSISTLPASAAMGGCNPRPQAASADSSSASWIDGAFAAAAAMFGL